MCVGYKCLLLYICLVKSRLNDTHEIINLYAYQCMLLFLAQLSDGSG